MEQEADELIGPNMCYRTAIKHTQLSTVGVMVYFINTVVFFAKLQNDSLTKAKVWE